MHSNTMATYETTESIQGRKGTRFKEWVLTAEELGEKVEGSGGSKVYAHVQWANRLTAHIREAEDTSRYVLGEVFKDLPHPVKDLIRCKK